MFTVAVVLAAAAGASAIYAPPSNVTVVTEVVDVYTTYCPYATQITHGSKTYTVTEATTLTISDCPCTVTRPIYVTSSVVCSTCGVVTSAPVSGAPPAYTNSTIATRTYSSPAGGNAPVSSGSATATGSPSSLPTSGAGRAVLSGAGLAGLVGLAVFIL